MAMQAEEEEEVADLDTGKCSVAAARLAASHMR